MKINNNYSVLPNGILMNPELTTAQRIVLQYMCVRSNYFNDNAFYAQLDVISKSLHLAKSTVGDCLRVLITKEYLTSYTQSDRKIYRKYYKVQWEKIFNIDTKIEKIVDDTSIVVNENNTSMKLAAYKAPELKNLEIEKVNKTENTAVEVNNNEKVYTETELLKKIAYCYYNNEHTPRNEVKVTDVCNIKKNIEIIEKIRKQGLIFAGTDKETGEQYMLVTDNLLNIASSANTETVNENIIVNTSNREIDWDSLKRDERVLLQPHRDMLWGIRKRYKNNGKKPIIYKEYAKEKNLSKDQNDMLTLLKNGGFIDLYKDNYTNKYVFKPSYKKWLK